MTPETHRGTPRSFGGYYVLDKKVYITVFIPDPDFDGDNCYRHHPAGVYLEKRFG